MSEIIEAEMNEVVDPKVRARQGAGAPVAREGYAHAVLPITAQAISTPADGLVAGAITVAAQGGPMPAYRAMPLGDGPFPMLIVVQEIFGVHEYIKDVCRRFAKLGYFAIAPELYARQGDPTKIADVGVLIKDLVSKVSDDQVNGDLDACVGYARASGKVDVARLGITGFCWGGRTVFMYAAHNPQVKAAVAWYGPTARAYHEGDKVALDVAAHIKAATLGLFGGDDHGIPVDTVEKMFAALKAAGNNRSEVVVYPDTPHAFFADYRESYTQAAAEDGWARCTAWFKANL
jgi:carboxymethylenebutenolidase